jgi:hypothetical protein
MPRAETPDSTEPARFALQNDGTAADVGARLRARNFIERDLEFDGGVLGSRVGGEYQIAPVGKHIPAFAKCAVRQNIGVKTPGDILAALQHRAEPREDIARQGLYALSDRPSAFVCITSVRQDTIS